MEHGTRMTNDDGIAFVFNPYQNGKHGNIFSALGANSVLNPKWPK